MQCNLMQCITHIHVHIYKSSHTNPCPVHICRRSPNQARPKELTRIYSASDAQLLVVGRREKSKLGEAWPRRASAEGL